MTTEQTDIRAAVLAAIAEMSKVPPATGSQTFEDLGIDSLDFVRLVQVLEDELAITLSDDQAAGITKVDELIALCESVVGEKTSAD